MLYVAVSQIIQEFCDEHLFGQANKSTGCYKMPVFRCTNVHLWRNTHPLFRRVVLDGVMSQSELTQVFHSSALKEVNLYFLVTLKNLEGIKKHLIRKSQENINFW